MVLKVKNDPYEVHMETNHYRETPAKNQSIKLDVRKFKDARSYILAYYQHLKLTKKSMTLKVYSQYLGMKNSSTLTKILNGERSPGPQLIKKMNSYYGFSKNETDYFANLIILGAEKNVRRKTHIISALNKDYQFEEAQVINLEQFKLISSWYGLALREFVKNKNFNQDLNQNLNAFRFKITSSEMKKAMETLTQLELLKKNESNQLEVAKPRVHTTQDVPSEAIKQYHESTLDLARQAVRMIDVHDREFQATCLTIDKTRLGEAKEMMHRFQEEFSKTFEQNGGDETYQLQMQFYPLTKTRKIKENK